MKIAGILFIVAGIVLTINGAIPAGMVFVVIGLIVGNVS